MQADVRNNADCLSTGLLVSLQAGELYGDELSSAEEHIKSCSKCRHELAGVEDVVSILLKDDQKAACDVADAVMERIDGKGAENASSPLIFSWELLRVAALVAAALVLGIIVSGVLHREAPSTVAAKTALDDAAEWLVSVQEEDGSWNPAKWGGRRELGASLTGLAMLAIMRSDIDAETSLRQAGNYLKSIQDGDGRFGPECAGSLYNQGIASKALIELRKTGVADSEAELDSALAYMLKVQLPSGGWSYREADSRNSSIGVSVWQLDALNAAREAGVKGLESGLMNGMVWLQGVYSGKGDFFNYGQSAERDEMSSTVRAMGAMCMLSADRDILGMFDSEKINQALASAFADGSDDDPYKSYFIASAASASDGTGLANRLADMRDAIAGKRITKGVNAGSWDADVKWGSVGGRIYSTSMAALALSNSSMEI